MKNSVYQKYYQNQDTKHLQMGLYSYGPPPSGRMVFEGKELFIKDRDFRTVERYREYMDCGFNILLGQFSGIYFNEPWETCGAKKVLDVAHEAGLDKVIIVDRVLMLMSFEDGGLIGEDKQFKNENDLDAFVKERMSVYVDHPAFYGVQFRDEPKYTMFKAYGQLYRSIKRVYPKVFIQCNLFGLFFHFNNAYYPPYDDVGRYPERFKRYLEMFLDETGADYIMMDEYGMYEDVGTGLYPYFFLTYQIMTQVAKERGVKLMFVAQSFSQSMKGIPQVRKPNKDEIFYQINAFLGFGVKELAYYTYWSGGDVNFNGETRGKDSSIMGFHGDKTPLYDSVKKANAMIQKLAPVILNFEHQNDTYAVQTICVSKPMHLQQTLRGQLKYAHLSNNQEVSMAFEMYDKKNNQYLYVVENITCPKFGKDLPLQETTIAFTNSAWTKVDVFDENEWRTEELKDGKFTVSLANGHAVYLMPY